MEKHNSIDIFVRERLVKVLTNIKELQNRKFDADIEDIKNYDIEAAEIFFSPKRHADIKEELDKTTLELKLLLAIDAEGLEFLTEKLLPDLKANMPEENYKEIEALAVELIDLSTKDIEVGSEAV